MEGCRQLMVGYDTTMLPHGYRSEELQRAVRIAQPLKNEKTLRTC